MRIALAVLFSFTAIVATAQSKELKQKLEANSKKTIDLPLDHAIALPPPMMQLWDEGYRAYNRMVPDEVAKTQLGMVHTDNGVTYWWIYPSARPHAQLDSATMIDDITKMQGDWRAVANRVIVFEDSLSAETKQYYRTSRLIRDNNADDVALSITEKKFALYVKDSAKTDFKKVGNSRYKLSNRRYLMRYQLIKAAAGISLAGIDNEGRLIINANIVEERKIPYKYIVYHTTVQQMIFERL